MTWIVAACQPQIKDLITSLTGAEFTKLDPAFNIATAILERADFKSRADFETVVSKSTLTLDLAKHIWNPRARGILGIFPRRERDAEGKFRTVARWAKSCALKGIMALFHDLADKFTVYSRFGTPALKIQLEGNAYLRAIEVARNNQLEFEQFSEASVTTGFVVADPRTPDDIITTTIVERAFRHRLEREYEGRLAWGAREEGTRPGSFKRIVYISGSVSQSEAITLIAETHTLSLSFASSADEAPFQAKDYDSAIKATTELSRPKLVACEHATLARHPAPTTTTSASASAPAATNSDSDVAVVEKDEATKPLPEEGQKRVEARLKEVTTILFRATRPLRRSPAPFQKAAIAALGAAADDLIDEEGKPVTTALTTCEGPKSFLTALAALRRVDAQSSIITDLRALLGPVPPTPLAVSKRFIAPPPKATKKPNKAKLAVKPNSTVRPSTTFAAAAGGGASKY
jgi:hypothetical protein